MCIAVKTAMCIAVTESFTNNNVREWFSAWFDEWFNEWLNGRFEKHYLTFKKGVHQKIMLHGLIKMWNVLIGLIKGQHDLAN